MLKPLGMSSPLADFVAVLRRQVNEADLTQLDLPESTGRWLFWGQWMGCRFLEVFFPSLTSQKTSYKSAGFCSFLTSLHISSHLLSSFLQGRGRGGQDARLSVNPLRGSHVKILMKLREHAKCDLKM